MLEIMSEFFDRRLDSYDEHQLNEITGAKEFYPFTASLLPRQEDANILDLGCGTGLELGFYFQLCPTAKVTGIDLAIGMLKRLREKFSDKSIDLICGSYFDIPLGDEIYDAAVSVESLHHFTAEEKISLYKKVYRSLKPEGYFILTDYFAASDAEESFYRHELVRLSVEQGLSDGKFYHYDTPLTIEHEIQAVKSAGFTKAEIIANWDQTYTLKIAKKA